MAASRALPASDVFPARLILLLAAGRGYAAVKRELHTTAPTIARWKQRFLEKRIDGLVENRHRHHARAPGGSAGGHPAPAHGWLHPLVVPETGARARPEQGRGPSHLAHGGAQAAPHGGSDSGPQPAFRPLSRGRGLLAAAGADERGRLGWRPR
ncbi:MAG: helix-turn-helix domain-containing protein [Bryobacteraceae bacterium]|nr:helix-turn-helix domain-containing protein [Bryobacteraceae bacterium]